MVDSWVSRPKTNATMRGTMLCLPFPKLSWKSASQNETCSTLICKLTWSPDSACEKPNGLIWAINRFLLTRLENIRDQANELIYSCLCQSVLAFGEESWSTLKQVRKQIHWPRLNNEEWEIRNELRCLPICRPRSEIGFINFSSIAAVIQILENEQHELARSETHAIL